MLGGIPVISLSAFDSCAESVASCVNGNYGCISGIILGDELIFINYCTVI